MYYITYTWTNSVHITVSRDCERKKKVDTKVIANAFNFYFVNSGRLNSIKPIGNKTNFMYNKMYGSNPYTKLESYVFIHKYH